MARVDAEWWTIGLSLCIAYMFALGSAQQQLCATRQSFNGVQRVFAKCQVLGPENALIAWTLDPTTSRLNISFTGQAVSASGWVGWGINPKDLHMAGTSALIAFKGSNGNSIMNQYKLTQSVQDSTSPLNPGTTDLLVLEQDVSISGTTFLMYASLQLKPNQTVVNLIWNRGPGVNGLSPQPHSTSPSELLGTKAIDMSSGIVTGGGGVPHQHLRNTHGVLAAVSWGVLLPLGAMAARYLRAFDPAWFYIHIAIQFSGYILGVSAWALGLRLGHYSQGVVYHQHRRIGITLFCFATLQVLAIALRPSKEAKIRIYWNVYHHAVGYTTIVLASINIFKGLDILQPGSGWRTAYIVIISTLGGVSIVLEIITWSLFFIKRRRQIDEKPVGNASSNGGVEFPVNGFSNGAGLREA